MQLVAISVEGQTEERFIKQVLQPYFQQKGIYLEPISLITKRTPQRAYRGGIIPFEKAIRDLKRLLNPKYVLVTTFYDYYGLKECFIPEEAHTLADPYQKVFNIEKKMQQEVNNSKFLPYIQLHEFEAFLFIDAELTCKNLASCKKDKVIQIINNAKQNFQNPELINNSEQTAPSKRLLSVYPSYQKTYDGPKVCEELGIQKIIDACPHFKEWINNVTAKVKELSLYTE